MFVSETVKTWQRSENKFITESSSKEKQNKWWKLIEQGWPARRRWAAAI
jgi:hypothetical protein